MRFYDTQKLVLHEYKYEKMEWIVSEILQILIFSCVLFLLCLVWEIDNIGSDYLNRLYPDGYPFVLKGYRIEDKAQLEKIGFYQLNLEADAGEASGTLNNLDGIWGKKIQAVLQGKDIWNEDIDRYLIVVGFFEMTLGAISLVMFVVMLNNLSNSFTMKLLHRKEYIRMLYQLGCSQKQCRTIYNWFFSVRNAVALLTAMVINIKLIGMLNQYLYCRFAIDYHMSRVNVPVVLGVWLAMEWLMRSGFRKIWGKMNENN